MAKLGVKERRTSATEQVRESYTYSNVRENTASSNRFWGLEAAWGHQSGASLHQGNKSFKVVMDIFNHVVDRVSNTAVY